MRRHDITPYTASTATGESRILARSTWENWRSSSETSARCSTVNRAPNVSASGARSGTSGACHSGNAHWAGQAVGAVVAVAVWNLRVGQVLLMAVVSSTS